MREMTVVKERGAVDYHAAFETLNRWLQSCANGEYTISMKRCQKKRTDPQNKLMWVWFGIIAREWTDSQGYVITPEDVHDVYCTLFLPKNTPKGRIAGSTSGLSVEAMTEFLNRVQADAETEYGIQLPSPEDKFLEEWAAEYCN